jgi:hypothetical protein
MRGREEVGGPKVPGFRVLSTAAAGFLMSRDTNKPTP